MKQSSLLIIMLLFVGILASNAYGQCSGGRINGIYYTSCFPWMSGDGTVGSPAVNDDRARLQRAIDAIPSGKLVFNEGEYNVSNYVELHSYLILEGTSTNAEGGAVAVSSRISLRSTNASIFKIGGYVFEVTIRDIALSSTEAKTGTIGILAEAGSSTTCRPNPVPPQTRDVTGCASWQFQFNNITFSNFDYGIKAQQLTNIWQFDNVKLEHSTFYGCNKGVYINSYNSGWRINSIEFFIPADGYGIYIQKAAYTTIDSIIGNGSFSETNPPLPLGEALIYVVEHGSLTIRNVISEGVEYDLDVDGVSSDVPINLTANFLQNKVEIDDSTVYATANRYGSVQPGGPVVIMPKATGSSQIYSLGEKFCYETSGGCLPTNGGWELPATSPANASTINVQTLKDKTQFGVPVDIAATYGDARPLLNIIAGNAAGNLIQMGQSNYHYTLRREGATTGDLSFEGNQAMPYKGYKFDAPVKLPNFTASTLPALPTNGSYVVAGSMVYCSDCQAGTTPCATGTGGGALAVAIGSSTGTSWSCK